jgi:hypothetical protein
MSTASGERTGPLSNFFSSDLEISLVVTQATFEPGVHFSFFHPAFQQEPLSAAVAMDRDEIFSILPHDFTAQIGVCLYYIDTAGYVPYDKAESKYLPRLAQGKVERRR